MRKAAEDVRNWLETERQRERMLWEVFPLAAAEPCLIWTHGLTGLVMTACRPAFRLRRMSGVGEAAPSNDRCLRLLRAAAVGRSETTAVQIRATAD